MGDYNVILKLFLIYPQFNQNNSKELNSKIKKNHAT